MFIALLCFLLRPQTEPFIPSAWTILDPLFIPDLLMIWTLLLVPLLNHEKALPWREEPPTQELLHPGRRQREESEGPPTVPAKTNHCISTESITCWPTALHTTSVHQCSNLSKSSGIWKRLTILFFNLILNAWFFFYTKLRTSEFT